MSRRRTADPALVTILWRDIPSQVLATANGVTEKALLPGRFQHAIDRAAKVAGKTDAHAYVAEWRRVQRPLDGDPAAAVAAHVDELVAGYPRQRLATIVGQGGLDLADQTLETAGGTP